MKSKSNARPQGRSPRSLSAPARVALAAAALSLGVGATSRAEAQVEARCPQGFTVIPPIATANEGQRPVLACARPPLQLGALEVARTFEPGSEEESGLVFQLVSRLGISPQANAVQGETIAGTAVRIAELHGRGQSPEGAEVEVEAVVAMVRVGQRTLVVRGLSTDGTRAHVRPAVQQLVPTMLGLDGGAPDWRATATCPEGTQAVEDEPPGNGMRRVALCATGDERRRVEVLESRLPLRSAAEARAGAEHYQQMLNRALAPLGGRVTVDATTPFTAGALRGFATMLHATATPPPGMPGAPPGGIRLEMLVAAVTTTAGHVQVVLTADGANPAEMQQAVQQIVERHVRLDGARVPPPDSNASAGPGASAGGAASSGPSAEPGAAPSARPRQRRIDPNAPLWSPGQEEPLRATDPSQGQPRRGACGCRVAGADASDPARSSRAAGALALVALAGSWLARRASGRRARRGA